MELSNDDCRALLEEIRWQGTPRCPYCGSTNSTSIKKENRHHCNSCFNSYSVTIGTIFHGSHVPLSKWFKAIYLYLDTSLTPKTLSVRSLAKEIRVDKDTASSMLKRIRFCIQNNPALLISILSKRSKDRDESE